MYLSGYDSINLKYNEKELIYSVVFFYLIQYLIKLTFSYTRKLHLLENTVCESR